MLKSFRSVTLAVLLTLASFAGLRAANNAWPANYQGVMLQGFYWDSYDDSKWTNLTAQADELSKYFSLIWVPNSAKSVGSQSMGYMPVYWFTNHNSSFGTQGQLRTMINTFKEKGTGIIADVVINHRAGVRGWTDFPTETWNGREWHIGTDGICRNDECNNNGYPTTGAYDTGENYDSARDLDHTNANVQENCKNYCKFLIDELGYAGFRYDMVKGYDGKFNKIYNEYSGTKFSVGEYFDSSYDRVAAWIEATGKQSAAFDFPFKYAVNEAFHSGDLTKLVWNANGTTPQPAGLIHFGYSQYSVTFIDNHDTYRDGSKFNGNVMAANAFMLCSPGTPCVFLPHWKANKAEIAKLITIRNSVGLHNNSAVKVLKTSRDCYMAEVTGTKGTLVVKIGSSMDSPAGYTASDIAASGNDYCVWTKTSVGGGDDPIVNPTPDGPAELYLLGDLKQGSWMTNVGVPLTKDGKKFTAKGVELTAQGDNAVAYFSFVTAIGTTGETTEWDDIINSSDRYGATANNQTITAGTPAAMQLFAVGVNASSAYAWGIAPGTYDVTADFDAMTVTLKTAGQGDDPVIVPDPDKFVVYFDNANAHWTTPYIHYWGAAESTWPGVAMTLKGDDIWEYTVPQGTTGLLFNAGDGDASKTPDFVAVNGHVYTTSGDQGHIDSYERSVDMPATLYVIGNLEGNSWNPATPVEMTRDGNRMYAQVTFATADTNDKCWFSLCSAKGASWDDVNGADRFGPATDDTPVTLDGQAEAMTKYAVNVSASACKSWTCAPGKVYVVADFANNTVALKTNYQAGIDDIEADDTDLPATYYTIQGVRVDNPTAPGLYIEVRGTTARKILVK